MIEQRENYPDSERPLKETIPSNYRLITCLFTMWNILIAQIKELYCSLAYYGLFLKEHK